MRATTATLAQEGAVLRVLITRLPLALGLRRSQHVRVMLASTATLRQAHAVRARLAGIRVKRLRMATRPLCAMRVLRTRLLLALDLRHSQHVRVMRATTATLRQAHAVRARLAGTRVKRLRMATRPLCAMRVQRTRLLLALDLRRSQHVRVMRDTTAMLHQGHAVRARLAGTRVRRLRMVTRIQCAMRVQLSLIHI